MIKYLLVGALTTMTFSSSIAWSFSPPISAAWTHYVQGLAKIKGKIQKDCLPQMVPAEQHTKHRGSIMFLHGYTACPQQYLELSKQLAEEGYDSYLFLMPNHGMLPLQAATGSNLESDGLPPLLSRPSGLTDKQWKTRISDGRPFLPSKMGWRKYLNFTKFVNQVAQETPGEKVISGLSVGGGMAMAAIVLEPNLYTQAMLFSPYLTLSNTFVRDHILPSHLGTSSLNWLQKKNENYSVSWGQDCAGPERSGYCTSTVNQILATEELGAWVRRNMGTKGQSHTQIQWMGPTNDHSADGAAAIETLKLANINFSACTIPGAPHSFFAGPDLAGVQATWLPYFTDRMKHFLVEGKFWTATVETIEPTAPAPHCVMTLGPPTL